MNKFFSYDPMDVPALKFHETSQQAKAAAEKSLDQERDVACEGWSPEVIDNPICWGVVSECMVETSRRKMTKSEAKATGFDEAVDYELREVS